VQVKCCEEEEKEEGEEEEEINPIIIGNLGGGME
jgi:hypothetical protein